MKIASQMKFDLMNQNKSECTHVVRKLIKLSVDICESVHSEDEAHTFEPLITTLYITPNKKYNKYE